MEKKKKKWVQPELIIMVRSKPEEVVLFGCKYAEASTAIRRRQVMSVKTAIDHVQIG